MKGKEPSDPLARLSERLEKARRQRSEKEGNEPVFASGGLAFGFRIGIELVSALAVGVGLGLLADRFLGTQPWGVILGFFLGAVAGMLNAIRAMREIEKGGGSRPRR